MTTVYPFIVKIELPTQGTLNIVFEGGLAETSRKSPFLHFLHNFIPQDQFVSHMELEVIRFQAYISRPSVT